MPAPRLVLAFLFLATSSVAQTVTVNTVEDVTDFAPPQTVAQLPGPDGRVSFREACTAANNTPGPQTIAFAIPKSDWWLDLSQALLKQEQGIFSLDDDATTVDFTTQTAFTGDTNPAGHEVGIFGLSPNELGVASIYVNGDDCLIKGLDRVLQRGYALEVWGSHNRVVACTISGPLFAAVYLTGPFGGDPSVGNIVGGTAPGEGNVLSAGNTGVRIDAPSEDNVVIGNVLSGSFSGVEVRGSQFTTTAKNNRIGGPTPAERNVIAGAGHYGEEGFPVGAQVSLEWAEGTVIEGNFIGTTADGLASAQQIGPTGIELNDHVSGTVIRGNLISGLVVAGVDHYQGQLFGTGILFDGSVTGTVIQGNHIGTDATGAAPLPNHTGLRAQPVLLVTLPLSDTLVGGTASQEGNVMAFNDLQGVLVAPQFSGVRISGNSIHDNGLLGIDLLPIGPTPNDPKDPDMGANGLQNAPVLASAVSAAGGTSVTGSLDSLPSQSFSVEFFASPAGDPSGFGEGRTFLGAIEVSTDATGHAAFVAALPPAAGVLSATATQLATGNTSEFSAWLQAGPWTDLGFAKAGSSGTPSLVGSGPLTPGSANVLALAGAKPSSPATLAFGFSAVNLPFKGGIFVPQPLLLLPQATDATGAASLAFTWPAGAPAGVTLVFQEWIKDPGASFGLSASNGLQGVSD
jgi:hypothetical protein